MAEEKDLNKKRLVVVPADVKEKILNAATFKGKTVVMASQDQVGTLSEQVDIVLAALGHYEAFVSDESKFSDFLSFLDEEEEKHALESLQERLGVPVSIDDCIHEVAARIKEAGTSFEEYDSYVFRITTTDGREIYLDDYGEESEEEQVDAFPFFGNKKQVEKEGNYRVDRWKESHEIKDDEYVSKLTFTKVG